MSDLELLKTERQVLVAWCRTLKPQDWNAPSWCVGWSLRDVVVHLLALDQSYFRDLFKAAGRPNAANHRGVLRGRKLAVPELLRRLEVWVEPMGLAKRFPRSYIPETWVHLQDMQRALGREQPTDPARMRLILDYLWRTFGRRHNQGIYWVASDLEWRVGDPSRPQIEGPAADLAMAIAGRVQILDRLHGAVARIKRK